MASEICTNCGVKISRTEIPQILNDRVVCARCRHRLGKPREKNSLPLILAFFIGSLFGAGVSVPLAMRSMRTVQYAVKVPSANPTATRPTTHGEFDSRRFGSPVIPVDASDGPPTSRDFRDFISYFKREFDKHQQIAFGGRRAGTTMDTTVVTTLANTDLKHSDSVDHPIVGVAVINVSRISINADPYFSITRNEEYTISFARTKGKWSAVRSVNRVLTDRWESVGPPPPNNRDETGKVTELDTTLPWLEDPTKDAQKQLDEANRKR